MLGFVEFDDLARDGPRDRRYIALRTKLRPGASDQFPRVGIGVGSDVAGDRIFRPVRKFAYQWITLQTEFEIKNVAKFMMRAPNSPFDTIYILET